MESIVIFYNEDGRAIAYIDSNGESIYLYSGEPVAWLSGESIYNYNGKYLGWFQQGWVFDCDGDRVFFTENSSGGPAKPARSARPARGARGARPARGAREVRPAKPVRSLNWSNLSGEEFFEQ